MKSESTVSEAKLMANRVNAQLSSGPRTAAGKVVSSMNAVKTGLTGRTVLLPSDDAEAYSQHLVAYENEFKPVGLRECELVQSLADIQWRLQRIPGLEMAIYARGRDEFADQFEDFDPAGRSARIDLETFLHHQKPLRNLQIQESRLQRQRQKDIAELRALQAERRATDPPQPEAKAAVMSVCDLDRLASYFLLQQPQPEMHASASTQISSFAHSKPDVVGR